MRSRRDLRRINRVMGQAGLMAAALKTLPQPKLLIDLGSGDGRFLLQVARRLEWIGVRALIADRQDIVSDKTKAAFRALQWKCDVAPGDVFEFLSAPCTAPAPPLREALGGGVPVAHRPPAAVVCEGGGGPIYVTANLFLHHFEQERLKRLLALVAARADTFVAVEPRRSALARMGAKRVWFLGANRVTRHDAVASVRAGFCGDELTLLWPQQGWNVEEKKRFPFSHTFVARRDEA